MVHSWCTGIRPRWRARARRSPRGRQAGCPRSRHCQSKFYTARSRTWAGWSSIVFIHKSPTHSAKFDAENGLYLFVLTVPRRAVLTFKVSLLWISLRRGLLSPTPNIFARPHRGKPPSNLSPSDIAARSPYNNFTSTRGERDGLDHTEDRRSMRRNGSDELQIGRTLTRAARSKYEPRLERVRGFFSAT